MLKLPIVWDVNSNFNLCVVTKYQKWEMSLNTEHMLYFASFSLSDNEAKSLVFTQKDQQKHIPMDLTVVSFT